MQLANAKILLTRPIDSNHEMIAILEQRKVPYLVTPLLSIEAIDSPDFNSVYRANILIFVSVNAVKFAALKFKDKWPNAHYIAVGKTTGDALFQFGIKAEVPLHELTEGLLELPSLIDVKSKTIAIIRGVGGRETLATELIKRNAKVLYVELYHRVIPKLVENTVQTWFDFGINTIMITSGAVFDNLINLVPISLLDWLKSCCIIVPSARVEASAIKYGMKNVVNANGANCQSMLQALA